jgi:glycosyltransferase involved in cell wall biosynthesis
MSDLRRLVFTWMSTADGGAEECLRALVPVIASGCGLVVDVVIWNQGPRGLLVESLHPEVNWHECCDREAYLRTLSRCLKGAAYGAVLFSNHRTFALDMAEARRKRARCAVVVHGVVAPGASIRIVPSLSDESLAAVPWEQLDWRLLSGADAIIAVSDAAAESLRPFVTYPERIHRIYNPIRSSWFVGHPAALRVHNGVERFLIASRLVAWKSVDVAVEGFLRLAREFPSVTLDIIGEGPELEALRRLVKRKETGSRVLFRGWQSDPQRWYQQSDCLIHSSLVEGFGRSVAEANAAAAIAVGPDCPGIGELIIDGVTGFTFRDNNVDGCYATLKKVMALSAETRLRMSMNAWRRSRTLFEAMVIAGEYVGLARQLA